MLGLGGLGFQFRRRCHWWFGIIDRLDRHGILFGIADGSVGAVEEIGEGFGLVEVQDDAGFGSEGQYGRVLRGVFDSAADFAL